MEALCSTILCLKDVGYSFTFTFSFCKGWIAPCIACLPACCEPFLVVIFNLLELLGFSGAGILNILQTLGCDLMPCTVDITQCIPIVLNDLGVLIYSTAEFSVMLFVNLLELLGFSGAGILSILQGVIGDIPPILIDTISSLSLFGISLGECATWITAYVVRCCGLFGIDILDLLIPILY